MAGPLGRCENIRCFSVTLSVLALAIYSMYVYRMGILTTMEKRFNLTSKQSGFCHSSFEIGHLVFIFILTYYGRNLHYPRVLAIAAGTVVISNVALSSLHFFYHTDVLNLPKSGLNLSKTISYGDTCSPFEIELKNLTAVKDDGVCGVDNEESIRRYPGVYSVMVISMIIIGAALVPVNTFGVTYVDANVPDKKQAPLYIGLVTGMTSTGSFLGFIISAVSARVYVNPEDDWPSPEDPRWLGAWWIGGFALAALSAVSIVPMILFPKYLIKPTEEDKPTEEEEEKDVDKPEETHDDEAIADKETKTKTKAIVKEGLGMFVGGKKLMTNPVFIAACFGYTADAYIWSGLMPYIPKYLETQYRQTSWMANLLAAFMSGLACTTGNFGGGFIASKLGTRRRIAKFMLAANIISIMGLLGVMNITCDLPPIDFDGSHPCNSNCSCLPSAYTPVCGSDGVDYMTPCYAGCADTEISSSHSDKIANYTSCSCLPEGYAVAGKCDTNCNLLYLYGVFVFISVAFSDCNTPANIVIVLGTVDEELRSFALGIFNAILSALAFVPGPTIFGAVIDTLCVAWQKDDCGQQGSCLSYDVTKLRYVIHGLTAAFKSIGVICYLYMVIKFRNEKDPLPEQTENDDLQEEQQEMLPQPT